MSGALNGALNGVGHGGTPAVLRGAVALILAAGFSSRMRGFKPLLPLPSPEGAVGKEGTCPALACVAQAYRAAGVRHIVVVSGHRAEEVEAEAQRRGLDSVRNPHPEQGMFSSVRAGLQALPGLHAAGERLSQCFVHPVDIPLVRPLTLRLLWEARHAQRPALPTFRGEEGHPLLLPAALWAAAASWQGQRGLHGWLHSLPQCSRSGAESGAESGAGAGGLVHVPVPDSLILRDMDTDADYARQCRLASRGYALAPAEYRELLRLCRVRTQGLVSGQCLGQRPGQCLGPVVRTGQAVRHSLWQWDVL